MRGGETAGVLGWLSFGGTFVSFWVQDGACSAGALVPTMASTKVKRSHTLRGMVIFTVTGSHYRVDFLSVSPFSMDRGAVGPEDSSCLTGRRPN